MTATKRLEATVHGRVQGVGFRWWVRRFAAEHGLSGWVANDPSGTVRVVAEGAADEIDALAHALREGPPGAVVTHVEAQLRESKREFTRFEIRSGGHSGD